MNQLLFLKKITFCICNIIESYTDGIVIEMLYYHGSPSSPFQIELEYICFVYITQLLTI